MHPIWFARWLWEWFWHPQGMLVWAEANQGLLSIAALVSALILALIEQRRALVAEQFARGSDAAADRRAREASEEADRRMAASTADADRRARAAEASADRKARAAVAASDRKAELAILRASERQRREYIDVVLELLEPYCRSITAAQIRVEATPPNASDNVNCPNWWAAGEELIRVLSAILPTAPSSPAIILATQRTISALREPLNLSTYSTLASHKHWTSHTLAAVGKQIAVLEAERPSEITAPSRQRPRAKGRDES
jgi:vacuolar-type H+-ATPase subunit E/Vma4